MISSLKREIEQSRGSFGSNIRQQDDDQEFKSSKFQIVQNIIKYTRGNPDNYSKLVKKSSFQDISNYDSDESNNQSQIKAQYRTHNNSKQFMGNSYYKTAENSQLCYQNSNNNKNETNESEIPLNAYELQRPFSNLRNQAHQSSNINTHRSVATPVSNQPGIPCNIQERSITAVTKNQSQHQRKINDKNSVELKDRSKNDVFAIQNIFIDRKINLDTFLQQEDSQNLIVGEFDEDQPKKAQLNEMRQTLNGPSKRPAQNQLHGQSSPTKRLSNIYRQQNNNATNNNADGYQFYPSNNLKSLIQKSAKFNYMNAPEQQSTLSANQAKVKIGGSNSVDQQEHDRIKSGLPPFTCDKPNGGKQLNAYFNNNIFGPPKYNGDIETLDEKKQTPSLAIPYSLKTQYNVNNNNNSIGGGNQNLNNYFQKSQNDAQKSKLDGKNSPIFNHYPQQTAANNHNYFTSYLNQNQMLSSSNNGNNGNLPHNNLYSSMNSKPNVSSTSKNFFEFQNLNSTNSVNRDFETVLCQAKMFDSVASINDFQIEGELGKGSYATVKLASDKVSGSQYALKIYQKYILVDPHQMRNVKREISLLQQIEHQNIIKIFQAFEDRTQIVIVMQYVGRSSLHSHIKCKPDQRLDEQEAKRVFLQILEGIRYIHNLNIVHRDIQLENILLDSNKNVQIIDFGFSIATPPDQKLQIFCGTPSYMSPEIVSKTDYSGIKADIWALGILLYTMLQGQFPFKGVNDNDLFRQIKKGTVDYPVPVSDSAQDFIQKMLQVNPNQRCSANELLNDSWLRTVF